MPCLLALIVFAVLGIFSASHRKLASEAFDCVFRRITLRPCDTGFDTKVKAKVLGKLITRSPKVAQFVNKRFELLSWVFMIVFTASTAWVAYGVYNYWAWGNCNGPYQDGFCAFDPAGENNKLSSATEQCVDPAIAANALSLDGVEVDRFPTIDSVSNDRVVFLGCYNCDYTRKTYPVIKQLLEREAVDFTFIHFPTKEATEYLTTYDVCVADQSEQLFFKYVDKMFASGKDQIADSGFVENTLEELGADMEAIETCLSDEATKGETEKRMAEATETGIYGTPTIFVNGTAVVGPKPYRVYRRLLHNSFF
jgi:protein-disulfide isomerase